MFVSENTSSFSTIDHFVSNCRGYAATTEAGVIHNAGNTSNHSPIYAKIDVGQLKVDVEQSKSISRTSWSKASEDNKAAYIEAVSNKLNAVNIPDCVNCTNLHCTIHSDQIDKYTLEVLESIESAAKENLPSTGGGGHASKKPHDRIPGWN
jgi:hypothetical protein